MMLETQRSDHACPHNLRYLTWPAPFHSPAMFGLCSSACFEFLMCNANNGVTEPPQKQERKERKGGERERRGGRRRRGREGRGRGKEEREREERRGRRRGRRRGGEGGEEEGRDG